MNRPSLADELAIEALPLETKAALNRIYCDRDTAEQVFVQAKNEAFSVARRNIRAWFKNNDDPETCNLPQEKIDELVNYIDT
jgi:hypothetical protein